MIPYEDLVYALAEWRARQGLSTATTPTAAARPVAAKPVAPARPVASSPSVAHAAPVHASAASSPAYAPAAFEPGYGAPTPAHATAAYAFGGAAAGHASAGAPFGGVAPYEHQITDEDEVISLGDAQHHADPLSFEGARSGTQPGVAPGFGNTPGVRR